MAVEQKPLLAKTRKLEKCAVPSLQAPMLQVQQNYQPQIRTSSPISSTTSDSFDAPPDGVFPAVKHVSIRDLAYKKLRQQQLEDRLKQNSDAGSSSHLKSNGKLKLLAYNNFGHLTVHIIKGKSYKIPGDTYVRIDMLPDQECFYKKNQTPLLKQTKNQTGTLNYDEKFSFEVIYLNQNICGLSKFHSASSFQVNQVNSKDRICISVWSKFPLGPQFNSLLSSTSHSSSSSNSSSSLVSNDQFIGCFSFRIASIMRIAREASRPHWYHLLPESIGSHKHFRCHRSQKSHNTNEHASNKITHVNKDLIGMKKLKFRIKRNSDTESYGFTISGNCPCMVGKVDTQRHAFASGLRPGDYISALDGKNVSRATCDSVVKLIKSFRQEFEIEVYRENNVIEDLPAENVYYEIPNVLKSKTIPEKSKSAISKPFNLEVVLEEDENDSDASDIYYNSEIEYSADNNYKNPFNVDQIRHVDSDINTEDERFEDPQGVRPEKCAVKYLGRDAKVLTLNNFRFTSKQSEFY